jgi:HK97 gp10 family phage protein
MNIEIKGLEEIRQRLAKLDNAEAIENRALKKAGNHLVKELKSNAPYDDGTLYNNLKLKLKGDEIIVHTGRAFHAHIYEFGRTGGQTRIRDRKGKMRTVKWGNMKGDPFMTRTYEGQKKMVENIILEELRKGLGL